MIKRVLAGILAVVALTWAGPASSAATADDTYVVPARVSVSPAVIEPGGRSTITFSPGFFQAGEIVEASIAGLHASAARVVGADGARTLASDGVGGMTVVFVAPEQGRGPYAVTFDASRDYTAIITVVSPRDPGWGDSARTPPAPGWGDSARTPPAPGVVGPPPGGEDAIPGQHGAGSSSASDEPPPTPPDRQGAVEIPGATPVAPAWPHPTEVPWGILLLAAVALVVCTAAATLLLAARRRR